MTDDGCAWCGGQIPEGLEGFCSFACREGWWVDGE